jgi:glutathione S-transferase
VPALKIDDSILTENPVIISFINQFFPQAQLLPKVDSEIEKFQQLSDLCFCSSTLHPLITRFCKPDFLSLVMPLKTLNKKLKAR